MQLLLIILAILPQGYVNMLMEGRYEDAIKYCEEMMAKAKGYEWKQELGDIYYDKLYDLDKALEIYQDIIKNYKQKDGFVHYRIAEILELKEDYLNSAREYEIVATQFRRPPLDSFALTGVERCFKKNYQDSVASIDGYRITRLELDDRMAKSSPFARQDEKAVLDQMILERLLFVNALRYEVMDMDFYKENLKNLKNSLLLDEVYAMAVVDRAKPTEKEMKTYYKKNRAIYKVREELKGKEIIVDSDSLSKFLHDSLTKDINSFDTLAKLYSTAPTKAGGGNMGIIYKGTKPKEVEEIIFKTKPNKLTDIIPSENKFGIYYITEYKPERYRTFDELMSQLESSVKAEKTKNIGDKFIKDLRKKANIVIFRDSIISKDSVSIPVERIVARINGRTVLKSDVEKRNASQPQWGKVDITNPEEFENVLNIMIEEQLKLEFGERNKYYLNEGYFTKLQDGIRRLLDQGLYTRIVVEAVKVDSQEIKDYYKAHKEDFKIPESVRAKEIVVKSKKIADSLRTILLKDSTQFDTLAKEHSIAPTKYQGGETGPIRKGMRSQKFDEVAFKLTPGKMSKVFVTDDSTYNIIKIIEHNLESYRKFEEMAPAIEMNLRREKQGNRANEFLAKIKQEANIKIYLAEPIQEEKPEEQEVPEKVEEQKEEKEKKE